MPSLILQLPLKPTDASATVASAAAWEFDFVVQGDDAQVLRHGRAGAALLPAPSRSTAVVVVVPSSALSWHAVVLPAKVAGEMVSARADATRMRSVLSGVMEEQLLDDTLNLHFAVFAQPGAGAALWVAVCDRAWLRGVLGVLESAGFTVARMVPECEPVDAADSPVAWVSAAQEPALVSLCTATGVRVLPLGEAALELMKAVPDLQVLAHPAVLGQLEQGLGQAVQVHTVHEGLVRAALSERNLAQLEFSGSKRGRVIKRMGDAWRTFRHTRTWRPVRWALVALLAVQVVALNAAAYRQKASLAQRQAGLEAVLRQTFPDVAVVIDPALQMQREVNALALSRGAAQVDLAGLLQVLAQSAGGDAAISALDMQGAELRFKGEALTDAHAAALNAAVAPQGWQALLQGDLLVLQPKDVR